MELDVLVIAAHPDDAELNAGGTIASLVKEGKNVGIIDLTRGEMGTRGTPDTRKKEVEKASEILGIQYRNTLDLGDSVLENSRDNQLKIISELRLLKPSMCIIGAPFDRHPDHGKATQLCLDAIFYSGLAKFEGAAPGDTNEPWRPGTIAHYMQDRPFEPDFIVDISEYWNIKKEAILAFETQFNVSNTNDEATTYISNERYFKQIEARARYFGHLAGFEFGEPFKKANGPIGLTSISNLK